MSIKSLVYASCFLLLLAVFVFMVWAERGFYAWIVAGELAVWGSHTTAPTFFGILISFVACLVAMFALLERLGLPDGGKSSASGYILALGLPALGVAAFGVLAIYHQVTGDLPAPSIGFAQAVREASFLPRDIAFEKTELPAFSPEGAVRIHTETEHVKNSDIDECYMAFPQEAWPDPDTPVMFQFKAYRTKDIQSDTVLTGSIEKCPLPYFVRRGNPALDKTFAVVFEYHQTVHETWSLTAVMIEVVLGLLVLGTVGRLVMGGARKS